MGTFDVGSPLNYHTSAPSLQGVSKYIVVHTPSVVDEAENGNNKWQLLMLAAIRWSCRTLMALGSSGVSGPCNHLNQPHLVSSAAAAAAADVLPPSTY